MKTLEEVRVGANALERFASLLPPDELARATEVALQMRDRLARRVFWNLNSTAVGGGVAEMLQSILTYTRGIGIDTRWMVIRGNPEFFRLTKRLHHALHGSVGDGSPLDEDARQIYEATMAENAAVLASMVQPGDIVLLHDPQTTGLAPHLARGGAHVLWRCHIGHDTPGEQVDRGWAFLRPYLESCQRIVFSRHAYAPDSCDHGKSAIITPSIDPFAAKNQDLSEECVRTILVETGLVEGPSPGPSRPSFLRDDGTPSRVTRSADVLRLGRPPAWDTPLVVQVSRWDPLKDPIGVMQGFARLVEGGCPFNAELVLAGPNVSGVTDDPEGGATLDAVNEAWRALPHSIRQRVHLACIPTGDVQENAAIVNALQRHASVVVQKSLHEGFGLTVTEAMWKARPVVASAVGGIQDQIEDGVSGLLLKNPKDLAGFTELLRSVLSDPERAEQLGAAARERVRENFLGVRHLMKYAQVLEEIGI